MQKSSTDIQYTDVSVILGDYILRGRLNYHQIFIIAHSGCYFTVFVNAHIVVLDKENKI